MAKKRKKKPSKFDQMLERYGSAAFVSWFGIFFSSIGMFWVLLEVGTDVNALVETVVGWWGGDPSAWTDGSANAGQLAMAYLATQLVKPIRIGLFVALTPVVARFMGRKTPPAAASDATVAASTADAPADGSETPSAPESAASES